MYLESYTDDENAVSSPIMPVALVLLAAYAVAGAFMSVTEMAVDTVLLSYCIDCDENGGQAVNAPPLLNDAVRVHSMSLCDVIVLSHPKNCLLF